MIQYDPHLWWSHFFDIRGSMVKEILGRVVSTVVWATLVVFAYNRWGDPITISLAAHTLVGTALGLLLVFRTNSAYDRFWEGRKLWGGMVNETRNLARITAIALDNEPYLKEQVLKWTIAFCYAAMNGLRGKKSIEGARDLFDASRVTEIEKADHPALYCAREITRTLREARAQKIISDYDFVYIDNNVQLLMDYVGGCERIHRTPLPFAYLVHLRRALLIYCLTLPLALVRDFGWETVFATFAIAYVFFGIEEIGVEIEDPFGVDENDLPLESICGTIRRNLLEL